MVLKSRLPSAGSTISGFGKFPANVEHDGASEAGKSNANNTIRRSMPGALSPPVLQNKETIVRRVFVSCRKAGRKITGEVSLMTHRFLSSALLALPTTGIRPGAVHRAGIRTQ